MTIFENTDLIEMQTLVEREEGGKGLGYQILT